MMTVMVINENDDDDTNEVGPACTHTGSRCCTEEGVDVHVQYDDDDDDDDDDDSHQNCHNHHSNVVTMCYKMTRVMIVTVDFTCDFDADDADDKILMLMIKVCSAQAVI